MKIIDWLLEGDVVIENLTHKYLLDDFFDHQNKGYISQYLDRYDPTHKVWGGGIYSPKWISSTYTLLELKYMNIDDDHTIYQEATMKVLDGLWENHGWVSKTRHQDMCMSAMVLSLLSYGKIHDDRGCEIVDYILDHQMDDGGWNCRWDSIQNKSIHASVHTTIMVLEAFRDYLDRGYSYRSREVKQQVALAQECLLKRELFKSMGTGKAIHHDMITFHYPPRWKYDCFRALEYFARVGYPYDHRMKDALDKVKVALKKGYVNRGKAYSGKIHFPLETGVKGRFNTFRALYILKHYDHNAYQDIIETEFTY